MAEIELQTQSETVQANQVFADPTGTEIDGVPFQTSGRRAISFCGRKIYIESLADGRDGYYARMFGDELVKRIEEKSCTEPQSYYRDLVKKRTGP